MKLSFPLFLVLISMISLATSEVIPLENAVENFSINMPAAAPDTRSSIFPLPSSMTRGDVTLCVCLPADPSITLSPKSTKFSAIVMKSAYDRLYNSVAAAKCDAHTMYSIQITVQSGDEDLQPEMDESYKLSIGLVRDIQIDAMTIYGAMHGLTSLRSLIEATDYRATSCLAHGSIYGAPISISDKPKYSHRGVVLDTARNFYSINALARTIDGMSASKLNVLHLHLVDSQAFPVELKAYPEVGPRGALHPGQFYRQRELKELVTYAMMRGVRLIPEYDFPGHTYAVAWGIPNEKDFISCPASEPWDKFCLQPPCGQLNIASEFAYSLVDTIMKESSQVFTDKYVHGGGDEPNGNCYLSDPTVQAFMKEKKYSTLPQLLQHFEGRRLPINMKYGKTTMLWVDLLDEGVVIPSDASVVFQSWVSSKQQLKTSTSKGYKSIFSDADVLYLDCGNGAWIVNAPVDWKSWCDPYKKWEQIYSYDPIAANKLTVDEAKLVLGGEVALWSEQTNEDNLDSKLWPRAAASGAMMWESTPRDIENTRYFISKHRARLSQQFKIQGTPIWSSYCDKYRCSGLDMTVKA